MNDTVYGVGAHAHRHLLPDVAARLQQRQRPDPGVGIDEH
jgi:hypothetical protein